MAYQRTARVLPRLDKDCLTFLPSSVAFSKIEWKKSPQNDNSLNVLKPKQDKYTEFPSILGNRVVSGYDRDDIYSEIISRQLLDETLSNWQNTKYLPPIVLEKPSPKLPGNFKHTHASSNLLYYKPKTRSKSTSTNSNSSKLSSDILNINSVVLSKKPKRQLMISKNSFPAEQVLEKCIHVDEKGREAFKEKGVGGKSSSNYQEEKSSECKMNDKELRRTKGKAKYTRVRFASSDSVHVFPKIEM